jgi:uncharacterized membrane protein YjgN (DUF898 family)
MSGTQMREERAGGISGDGHSAPGGMAAGPSRERLDIEWRHPDGLYVLSLKNALLTFLTLGLYHFWAKTEVRRRLWRAVRINAQPLEYTGRGIELFKGALIVGVGMTVLVFLYMLGAGLLAAMQAPPGSPAHDNLMALYSLPLYVFFLYLWGVARHLIMRYRLRRTVWRGIRGTMGGRAAAYGWLSLWTWLPVVFSLGLLAPWRSIRLRNRLFSDMRFGSGRFSCRADWRELMPLWGLALLFLGSGVLLLVSLIWFSMKWRYPYLRVPVLDEVGRWYALEMGGALWPVGLLFAAGFVVFLFYEAKKLNVIANAVRYGDVRFSMDMTAGSVLAILVRNYILFLISFGILKPVMLANIAGHLVEHLKAEGELDMAAISQADDTLETAGEGLAAYLGIDGV